MLKSNLPLYIKTKNIIQDRIIRGVYEYNTYLPTEQQFVDEFDVSLVTIRKAIEILQRENYVLKKSGKGTLVVNNKIADTLSTSRSFTKILESKYSNLKKIIISNEYIQDSNNSFHTRGYTTFKRYYEVEGVPYIYSVHYVPEDLSTKKVESLYKELYMLGHTLTKFDDKFSVVKTSPEIALVLNYDGFVLQRVRKTYTDNDELIEIAYSYYNTEVEQYEFEFKV